jgi:pSer/pThr/pTyr-binding forkhead associated (FHA) protein
LDQTGRPVSVQPAIGIVPTTLLHPLAGAKLILPDKSEIPLVESVKSLGRNDFEKSLPPEKLQYVSRQQLIIKFVNGKYLIEDSDSANGTKVNGMEIKGRYPQELKDGDSINISDVMSFTFRQPDEQKEVDDKNKREYYL